MTHTPAPAEIETLRKIVAGRTCTEHDQRAAVAILDRLSPPEPEQPDEATVWTRKVLHAEYQITAYATGEMDDRAQFINARQVLSELIASKDDEIEQIVKREIGTVDQLEKALSELAALRAENERLRNFCTLEQCEEAAERNTAEPEKPCTCHPDDNPPRPCPKKYALNECRAASADTAPIVEVTQDDWDAAEDYYEGPCVPSVLRSCFAHHRTEAEARGRREALDAITARLEWYRQYGMGMVDQRLFANTLIIELKRMMTEGK